MTRCCPECGLDNFDLQLPPDMEVRCVDCGYLFPSLPGYWYLNEWNMILWVSEAAEDASVVDAGEPRIRTT